MIEGYEKGGLKLLLKFYILGNNEMKHLLLRKISTSELNSNLSKLLK